MDLGAGASDVEGRSGSPTGMSSTVTVHGLIAADDTRTMELYPVQCARGMGPSVMRWTTE